MHFGAMEMIDEVSLVNSNMEMAKYDEDFFLKAIILTLNGSYTALKVI